MKRIPPSSSPPSLLATRVEFVLWILLLSFLSTGVLDFFYLKEDAPEVHLIRIAAAVSLLGLIGALRAVPLRRLTLMGISLLAASMYSCQTVARAATLDDFTTSVPRLTIAVLTAAMLLPWGVGPQLAVVFVALAGFLGSVVVSGETVLNVFDRPSASALLFTLGFSVWIAHVLDRQRKGQEEAAEALRRSEANFRGIYEHLQDVFFRTDQAGLLVMLSPSVGQHGYRAADLIGQSAADFFVEPEQWRRILRELLHHGALRDVEVELAHRDGTSVQCSLNARLLVGAGAEGMLRDVSERKRTEGELRQTMERLHTVVNSAPLSLFATDRDGVITLCEGQGLRAIGIEPGALVGRSIFDVYQDVPRIRSVIQRVLAGKSVTGTGEFADFAFDSRLSPLFDERHQVTGVIAVAMDVTERQRAVRALEDREATIRAIVDTALDGILTVDEMGIIRSFNAAAERLFGYSTEEAVGRGIADLLEDDDAQLLLPAAIIDGEGRRELTGRCKDGRTFPMEVAVSAVRRSDRPLSTWILRDLRERKQAEESLKAEARIAMALARVGDALISALDRPRLLDNLGLVTAEALGCDASYTLLWDPKDDVYVPVPTAA